MINELNIVPIENQNDEIINYDEPEEIQNELKNITDILKNKIKRNTNIINNDDYDIFQNFSKNKIAKKLDSHEIYKINKENFLKKKKILKLKDKKLMIDIEKVYKKDSIKFRNNKNNNIKKLVDISDSD